MIRNEQCKSGPSRGRISGEDLLLVCYDDQLLPGFEFAQRPYGLQLQLGAEREGVPTKLLRHR